MVKANDPIGQRFGRLTVLRYDHSNKYNVRYFLCRCDCGNEKVVQRSALMSGATKSCGCLNEELKHRRKTNFKHGYCHKERLYETWKNMKRRCCDPNNKRYALYGGRGIKVCNEWLNDYMAFRNWAMANGYADNLSIDRIDNDKGYFPENCRWATTKVQENNMSRNHLLAYNGQTHTISEWAEILGMSYDTVNHRIDRKWPMERIVSTPQKVQVQKHA